MDKHSNCTVSFCNDTSTDHEPEYEFVQTPAVIAMTVSIIDGVLILFGAPINFAVIVTIGSHHQALKTMDLCILNLCLSDFASSIFYQPLVITRLLARRRLGSLESSLKMTTVTCLLADCAALFLVTFDKYIGIRFPLRYHTYFSKKKVVVIIICTWVTASAIGLIFALVKQSSMIAGMLYGLLIIIMFIVTTSLQIASFFIAKRHEQRMQRMQGMSKMAGYYSSTRRSRRTDNVHPSEESKLKTPQFSGYDTKPLHPFTSKAAKTITLLTSVFIMSWLPQIVLNVYFMMTFDAKTFFRFIYVFVAFQQLHVCINPFIYVFRTRCIRNKFFGRRNQIGELPGPGLSFGLERLKSSHSQMTRASA